VTKIWGYFLWVGKHLYITGNKAESSPRIDYAFSSNTWYNLKTVVKGVNVKIYVNDKFVYQLDMKGAGANSSAMNYVGIWCHENMNEQGSSFAIQGKYFNI
jgi:hypothetical protein